MSVRHLSRVAYQLAMRAAQGIKDQASKKCDSHSAAAVKITFKDSSYAPSSSRMFSGCIDSSAAAFKGAPPTSDKLRQAEESLRTVMYLSCWGPN